MTIALETIILGVFGTIFSIILGLMGFMLKRWIDSVDGKLDQHFHARVECQKTVVQRNELTGVVRDFTKELKSLHARFDEHGSIEMQISERLAKYEQTTDAQEKRLDQHEVNFREVFNRLTKVEHKVGV